MTFLTTDWEMFNSNSGVDAKGCLVDQICIDTKNKRYVLDTKVKDAPKNYSEKTSLPNRSHNVSRLVFNIIAEGVLFKGYAELVVKESYNGIK